MLDSSKTAKLKAFKRWLMVAIAVVAFSMLCVYENAKERVKAASQCLIAAMAVAAFFAFFKYQDARVASRPQDWSLYFRQAVVVAAVAFLVILLAIRLHNWLDSLKLVEALEKLPFFRSLLEESPLMTSEACLRWSATVAFPLLTLLAHWLGENGMGTASGVMTVVAVLAFFGAAVAWFRRI